MAALIASLNDLPPETLAFLCGVGPFFLPLTAAFAFDHVDGVRTQTRRGL